MSNCKRCNDTGFIQNSFNADRYDPCYSCKAYNKPVNHKKVIKKLMSKCPPLIVTGVREE
jgi:hypothetical protein